MRIMMSAAGSAVAPGIIRHLQKLGHTVIGLDACAFGKGLDVADQRWVSSLLGPAPGFAYDLYLPFLDEELLEHHSRRERVACSSSETLAIFTSKIKQQKAMEQAGLPIAPKVDMIMLKPNYGRGGKGAYQITPVDGYIAQNFIEGEEYTVDVLVGLDGKFLCAVPRLRIQTNGVSVIGRIKMDRWAIELAARVVDEFDFRGPINIQMIRDKKTGMLYIIEVNPRLSGSCMFTVMAGFDILDATIKLFSGEPFVPPTAIEEIMVRRYYVEEVIR